MAQGIVVVGSGVDPASYYNKKQVDDALAKKQDASSAYSKVQVDEALSKKLSTSGGKMTGYLDFEKSDGGLSWTTSNGSRFHFRANTNFNALQFVLERPGITGYSLLDLFANEAGDVCVNNKDGSFIYLKYGIVAQGDSYVRFGNGLQLCWTQLTQTVTNQTWSSVRVSYPVPFSAVPVQIVVANRDAGNILPFSFVPGTNDAKMLAVNVYTADVAVTTYTLSALSIGRWK